MCLEDVRGVLGTGLTGSVKVSLTLGEQVPKCW